MRLNLGCCDNHKAGYVNVDRCPPADQIADLDERWPWPDSSVDFIMAHDIIEHLVSHIHTMNEAHRVLKPGARMEIKVPTTDGPGADQDPTHRSRWNRNSFLYYTDGAAEWMRFRKSYGITARFRVISADLKRHNNDVVDLNIVLEAVK